METVNEHEYEARFLSVSEFQGQCSELIAEVAERGGEVVITRDGLPITRLISVHGPRGRPPGLMKGTIEIKGDIVGPIGADWFGVDKDRFDIVGDIVSPMPAEGFDESDDDPMNDL